MLRGGSKTVSWRKRGRPNTPARRYVVTHVSGMKRNPCVRNGPLVYWSGQLDSNQRPAVPKAGENSDNCGQERPSHPASPCKSLNLLIHQQSCWTCVVKGSRTASSHDLPRAAGEIDEADHGEHPHHRAY